MSDRSNHQQEAGHSSQEEDAHAGSSSILLPVPTAELFGSLVREDAVTEAWEEDVKNPLNWPRRRKYTILALVSFIDLLTSVSQFPVIYYSV